LGIAYSERVAGERAENIERAIRAFEQALTVFTREDSPDMWGVACFDLGIAYRERVAGERADNFERAIRAFEQALTVFTREDSPAEWAATQKSLGIAYSERVAGERAENVEHVIQAYEQALTVFTREDSPAEWAEMQNSLGIAYSERVAGERAENVERAIQAYEQALTVRTIQSLPNAWAETQHNLGIAYRERVAGERADNFERAIRAFEQALTVFTREVSPAEWAHTQNNLGITYRERVAGERAENVERAIQAYERALTVFTRQDSPAEWAMTQTNLGAAYNERVAGERADNVERAIRAFEQALTVFTREGLPIDWAATQLNLGVAYSDRVTGDPAENVERAIQAYERALTVFTREGSPANWAMTQHNLGVAYRDRVTGDPAENVERAIQAYERALTVFTREGLPIDWAETQLNLGVAYHNRVTGDPAENVERAIQTYERALTVLTREGLPIEWAATQHNLGVAYRDRVTGDPAENVERAIRAFEQALTVRTREALPIEWAHTQNFLGIAYSERVAGERAENVERAIQAYEQALTVFTREGLPIEWAKSQQNLGTGYYERIAGDRAENVERAIRACEQALTVFTREALPARFGDAMSNLGTFREVQGQWEEAHQAYVGARAVRRDLIALAENAQNRAALIAERAYLDIYLHDANVLLHLATSESTLVGSEKQIALVIAAAEVLEEGRAQALRAELDADELVPQHITDLGARGRAVAFIDARDTWRSAQRALGAPLPDGRDLDAARRLREQERQAVHEARLAFEQARDAIRERDNPDFLSPEVHLADLASQLASAEFGEDEALVYVAAGSMEGLALIIRFDERGMIAPVYLSLPRLSGAAIDALHETYAPASIYREGQDKPPQDTEEMHLVSGGFAQAQMGWAYANLQSWGASALEVLAVLPPTSGFALALLLLRDAWFKTSTRTHDLSLLETPFEALSEAQHASLASAFHDTLLRVELQRSLTTLGELGLNDLAARLQRLGITRATLIPYGMLALFPLPTVEVAPLSGGVARGQNDGGHPPRLGDVVEVTLAPSARAYVTARMRAAEADRQRSATRAPADSTLGARDKILAVGNPLPLPFGKRGTTSYIGNLPYAAAEADGVRAVAARYRYPPDEVLVYTLTQAQRPRVLEGFARAWYVHLALHGQFDPRDPRESHLILAGDEQVPEARRVLTLGECLDGAVRLEGLRLLTLSACETSLIETQRAPNEMVGMAAGFLQAGAAGVIASLWPVDDRATFLLMTRFMLLWLDPERRWSPARCLAEAQRWLREEATNAVIAAYDPARPLETNQITGGAVTDVPKQGKVAEEVDAETERELALAGTRSLRYTQATALAKLRTAAAERDDPDGLPYADPIYWAAFTVTGA
jgi:CHAT domain-containing protein/tetratricopeptide (TPR) repeat protein